MDFVNKCMQTIEKQWKESIEKLNDLKTFEFVTTIHIEDNDVEHSYESLYGIYLDHSAEDIVIEEPKLYTTEHYYDLTSFVSLVVHNCKQLKMMAIRTQRHETNPNEQSSVLESLKSNLLKYRIQMNFEFDSNLKCSKISLSNGYIIKSKLGLHLFKNSTKLIQLGFFDNNFHCCHANILEIWLQSKNPILEQLLRFV